MYALIIAFALTSTARGLFERLRSVEGGFAAFERLDWVLLVMFIVIIPLNIAMYIKAYTDLKEGREDVKRQKEEERLRQLEMAKEKFDLEEDGTAAPVEPYTEPVSDEGQGKYDN